MSVSEYEHEPVRGLPGYLPEGEELLWQGQPDFRTMALRVFHLRSVSIYLALLIAFHVGYGVSQGGAPGEVLLGSSWMVGLSLVAIGLLAGLARAYAKTTIYTITDKRLVMRFGVAMPMMVNLPLAIVGSGDMRRYGNGSGDIMLTLSQKKRLSYMMLWPNIRPWRFKPVVPAMRCLRDVDTAARALALAAEKTEPLAQAAAEKHRNDARDFAPATAMALGTS